MFKIEVHTVDGETTYTAIEIEEVYNIYYIDGTWTAIDKDNKIVDKDRYRYDLFDRLEMLYEK